MWRKLWRTAGSWSAFTPVARRLVRVDRLLSRVTRGRVVALGMAPSLLLTTTGRRSGLPRSSPLQFVRHGDDLVVIASNWGGESDPAWAWNLTADPRAVVTLGGAEIPVIAYEALDDDHERLWRLIVDQWPGYENYKTRASHRHLRIFRLSPSPLR
ncbi:nitroreductase/quinone reductase family protein [Actinoplanes solisilvae]|uniref:nitroreductase/quinone reductase family protein n=1 Tax=Actinoplanes solisilvae TaxID=2486853 RepID=UPI001F0C49DC|nr:nitroreductase/quinone reductase family protein [Actinoplanes solisilvae]